MSRDHTFVGVGHASGHINLFDLARPQVPARTVLPTSLAAVASGRKEGHVEGSRIVSLDFVGVRHTAIVSADEFGLAFYHSLGKVLFVEASDTLRILGKYPTSLDDPPDFKPVPSSSPETPTSDQNAPLFPQRASRKNTILGMASLPLGTATHPSENYNLVALLTPSKLVVVGLKPSARTWFRRHRTSDDSMSSKWTGCLSWFPSVEPTALPMNGSSSSSQKDPTPKTRTSPILAYSWGREIFVLRVFETRVQQTVPNPKAAGKTMVVEVGKIDFEEVTRWTTDADYIAVQWLNPDVSCYRAERWSDFLRLSSVITMPHYGSHGSLESSYGVTGGENTLRPLFFRISEETRWCCRPNPSLALYENIQRQILPTCECFLLFSEFD